MIRIYTDTRGRFSSAFRTFLSEHPRIAKEIVHVPVNNQPEDIIIHTGDTKIAIELKIGHDLHQSLVSGRLEKELVETYLPGDYQHRYVIICGTYNMKDLVWAVSVVDKFFPFFHLRLFYSLKHAVKGIVYLARQPPKETAPSPVLVRTKKKGLILSFSSLVNGITPELVEFLINHPDSIIHTWKDFFTHDREDVRQNLLKIFSEYYGRNTIKLVERFLGAVYE